MISDSAVDKALAVWREEADVAYSARVGDYLHPQMPPGPARDAALADLHAADDAAWAKNRDLMRRAIEAALKESR